LRLYRHKKDFGTVIALVRADAHFPSSPNAFERKEGKRSLLEMKMLKELFMGFVVIVGLSLAVAAQKNDQKPKPPPKETSPRVEPREKPPPRPPRDSRPKKP
jgi:hypothetical protein